MNDFYSLSEVLDETTNVDNIEKDTDEPAQKSRRRFKRANVDQEN